VEQCSSKVLPVVADVYYRYVRAEVATIRDFMSNGALGRTMSRPGNQRAWDDGISVWDTFASACERAEQLEFSPGSYVVEITLPDGHDLEVEGPTGRSNHHYTIYGADPQFLMGCAGRPVKMPGAP
jgi:hypothetical protein